MKKKDDIINRLFIDFLNLHLYLFDIESILNSSHTLHTIPQDYTNFIINHVHSILKKFYKEKVRYT